MRYLSTWRRQRGDTLIEVTFALAILSFVLIGSSAIATRGFRLGQTGRERTQISDQAQVQMEAIRSLRDNNTWNEFLYGKTGSTGFTGILNASSSTSCHVTSPCLHMALPGGNPNSELVPAGGGMAGSVPTSYIEVSVTPDTNVPAQRINIVLSYGFQPLGGGVANVGHISTILTDVQLAMATPTPTPAPPSIPTPTPTCTNNRDIVLALDHSSTMHYDPIGSGPQLRLPALQGIVNTFLNEAGIGSSSNHVSIEMFDSNPTFSTALLSDTAQLINDNNTHAADWGMGTSYKPALQGASNILELPGNNERPGDPKVIVLFTDGINDSSDSPGAIKNYADTLGAAGIEIWTIGLTGSGTTSSDLNLLKSLHQNGGQYVESSDKPSLQAAFDQIANNVNCN